MPQFQNRYEAIQNNLKIKTHLKKQTIKGNRKKSYTYNPF